MLYLIDTNTLSKLMRRDSRVVAKLASLGIADEAVTCAIVRGEILFGIERLPTGNRRRELEVSAANIFTAMRSLDIPDAAAVHYAAIRHSRQRAGRPMLENDIWIAATSLAVGAVLVSHDNDVRGVPGITVEDWW